MRFLRFLLIFPELVAARDRFFSLNIADRFVAPDGFPRSAVTVNGLTPGPLISAETGDRLLIKVTNHLQAGLSWVCLAKRKLIVF